ncbi:hypothetical protein TTRE_0000719301 [Trichuris trichiura]|uniref:Glycine N-acyltransferase-like protein n=1 Tax=Trichuris trichiura TaxID=36087 RepID=A0A077ZEQ0_TRITR|nr:hypothetical protein TTRE_0000719301 [Trichuris trichiura]
MHLLEETEYPALREQCKKFLPGSVVLFNMMSIKTAKLPLEIFVDHWPNATVIVIKSKCKWGNFSNYPAICAFSLYENLGKIAVTNMIVQSIFQDACKDYNGFILNYWPLSGIDILKEAVKEISEGNLEVIYFGSTRTFWIPPDDYEKLYRAEPTLPEGFYFDELHAEEAELVDSLWVHRFEGSVDHVRRFITTMPNVCVRNSDGQLAGFSMVHDLMGNEVHLYTMPEFRGRKIAFNIEIVLARKMLLSDLLPCKYVVPSNYEAMQMTMNSPFWKEINEEFAWLQVRKKAAD